MNRAICASAVVGSLLLAACGGAPPEKSASSTLGSAHRSKTFDCGLSIGTQPPPPHYRVVLGVVALPAAPEWPALQTSRSGLHDPAERLFAKTGLWIRAGSTFELTVPAALADRLAILWATAAPQHRRILVSDCRTHGASGSGWLNYPGGFFVPHPACVSLLVKAHNRKERVPIGLGTPCPGQKPPQGPSQS